MDRLRSPGGCPWDAAQTHGTLGRYLVEECYELLEATEGGDGAAIREELGDVLLQVLFHARIAAETPAADGGFDIDDVAAGLVAKLIRRHPDVFEPAGSAPTGSEPTVSAPTVLAPPGSAPNVFEPTGSGPDAVNTVASATTPEAPQVRDAAQQQVRWDELKRAEAGRGSVLAGVAFGQPALALAAKLGARAAKFDLDVAPPDGTSAAEQLFRLAYEQGRHGEDPEAAVRAVARRHSEALRAAESAG